MKKVRFLAVFLAVCISGYVLGRATTTGDAPQKVNDGHRDIPLFPAPPKADAKLAAPPKPDKNLLIEMPEEGTRPQGPSFEVSGRAKAGVPSVHVVVDDVRGNRLFEANAPLNAGSGEPFGRFSADVRFETVPTAPVTLTVTRDAAAGEQERRTVLFGQQDEVAVKAYFQNGRKNGDGACDLVFPEGRTVSGKTAVYRAALEALLKGPNADEVAAGYGTSIPAGVTVKSVAADANGVVTADFDQRLSGGVSDPCRITAIRAQIGATLKQFPEVRDVIISVNGKVEGVLQP